MTKRANGASAAEPLTIGVIDLDNKAGPLGTEINIKNVAYRISI